MKEHVGMLLSVIISITCITQNYEVLMYFYSTLLIVTCRVKITEFSYSTHIQDLQGELFAMYVMSIIL